MLDNAFALGVAISSLSINTVNLIYTFIQGRTKKTQNRLFISVLIILIANSITGIASAVFSSGIVLSDISHGGLAVSRYVYFATHTALCPLFYYYISRVSLFSTRLENLKTRLIILPFIITELMAITNPFTNFIWSVNENHEFQRERGEMLIYLAALLYFILAFMVLARSWSVTSKKRKIALVFFFVLVAVGVLLQFLDKNLKVEVLAESIGFTGVMMSVENEDDRIDITTGFYNRAALNLDIGSVLKHNRVLSLFVIKINNYDIINRIVGNDDTNVVADITSGYLTSVVRYNHIYSPATDTFVITVYEKNPEKVSKLADSIAARFEKPWDYRDFRIQLSATLIFAEIPEKIRSMAELFYMIESPVPGNIQKSVIKGDDLNYIIRRQMVEEAMSRGFSENSYEVYYQPTYHLNGDLHGAEALIRLHDKTIGEVYPDEFIPIAEQSGLIDDIDDYVLNEVCRLIDSGIPQKYGVDNINVNLSVLQCMRPRFVEHIDEIVESYGVDKGFINFEITESIAADDYDILSDVIRILKKEHFLFSMDDYGTGYSNVSSVFSLDLDVIKIDKSLLWGAEKDEMGMIILENTIRMIRQMKKKILVEGVETKEQIELLKKLQVDYLQGFYFSKPVPKDRFVEIISQDRWQTNPNS